MQDQPVPTRVYTPKVPYPVPAKKSRKNCEEMKCKKMLEELNVKLSLMDAIQMIPSMRSLVKGLISGKTSADSDIMMVVLSFIANYVVGKGLDHDNFVLSIREIKPKKLDTEPVRSQLRGDFLLGRDQAE
ncbi:hypothetical protein DY000_02041546 [Brassica cretica]|uniref:Uncharacterized protein n=1 Tax=Brassica cretica TaxID=69181 RepID=A0ABQ7BNL5_BRACR|nr:hypothetical protein DY000_02041546 [Brassica cretica]